MSQYTGIIFIVILIGLMYFLVIRPQQQRQKKHKRTLQDLKKGDQVVTVGGLYGLVDEIDRKAGKVTIDCDGIYLTFGINAIATANPPATDDKESETKAKQKTNTKDAK